MCDPMTTTDPSSSPEVGDVDGADGSDGAMAATQRRPRSRRPPTCRTQPMLCADGGYDGSPGVCEADAGICVQCLTDGDCSQDPTKPICEGHLCRPCKADSECKTDPAVCMYQDGHCATDRRGDLRRIQLHGCPGATAARTNPYCAPNDASLMSAAKERHRHSWSSRRSNDTQHRGFFARDHRQEQREHSRDGADRDPGPVDTVLFGT